MRKVRQGAARSAKPIRFVWKDGKVEIVNITATVEEELSNAAVLNYEGGYFTYEGIKEGKFTFGEVNPPMVIEAGMIE